MKRLLTIIFLCLLTTALCRGENRGIPFLRNFNAAEYKAHNRNFDIACDDYGTVYVANFEGLLYFDGSTWGKVHTPGISRVTCLAKGTDGKIWIGGYKVFGYLEADNRGCLHIHSIVTDEKPSSLDEVNVIKVTKDRVYVHTVDGKSFFVRNNKQLVPLRTEQIKRMLEHANDSINNLKVENFTVSLVKNGGLKFIGTNRERTISTEDGLCSDNVNRITYNGRNTLWGATEHGIFAIEIPSPYSHATEGQGLHGEVYSLSQLGSTLFIGTLQGLHTINNGRPRKVEGINFACWQLYKLNAHTLMASTSEGLWQVTETSQRRITDACTFSSVPDDNGGFITGELDGVYRVSQNGQRTKIAEIEKATKLSNDKGEIRAETIYGEVWLIRTGTPNRVECIRRSIDLTQPKLSFTDSKGRNWRTDAEGKDLSLNGGSATDKAMARWLKPLSGHMLNAIYCTNDNSLWIGGDFGVINCDFELAKALEKRYGNDQVFIRKVAQGDSVLWGGYSKIGLFPVTEVEDIELPSSNRTLTIHFSTRDMGIFAASKYRYRLNRGKWSKWSEATSAYFTNMAFGTTLFEVQAIDMAGNVSNTASVQLYIDYPMFMRWWAMLLYIVIIGFIVRWAVNYHEKKLLRDKEALEKVVTERTAELSERTAELSTALDDLQRTQADLVRMERTATAGKLTQGLIDRILNPINYINNFSKLTAGLAKDLAEDIEDEKDNMSEDNYEDCEDILDMMTQNLGKIEEHGVNTTRTLRAMEAMLKTQVGTKRDTDLCALCRQAVSVASEYHKESIAKHEIKILTELPDNPVVHTIDPETINNTLLAILTNAIYAVVKKHQRAPYGAEIILRLRKIGDDHLCIHIIDNGVGIEDTIIDKVFDPFFTTKTTGEAAGVGLYLAREIVQDHNGTISIKSEKDQYTELTINL